MRTATTQAPQKKFLLDAGVGKRTVVEGRREMFFHVAGLLACIACISSHMMTLVDWTREGGEKNKCSEKIDAACGHIMPVVAKDKDYEATNCENPSSPRIS